MALGLKLLIDYCPTNVCTFDLSFGTFKVKYVTSTQRYTNTTLHSFGECASLTEQQHVLLLKAEVCNFLAKQHLFSLSTYDEGLVMLHTFLKML